MPNIQTNVDESKTPDVSVSRSSVSDVAYSLHESVCNEMRILYFIFDLDLIAFQQCVLFSENSQDSLQWLKFCY